MRKLLKMLKDWNLKHDIKFDHWQRNGDAAEGEN